MYGMLSLREKNKIEWEAGLMERITINAILEERRKAIIKCNALSVQYGGSIRTKMALFNMLETIVSIDSNRVHYIETCGRMGENTLNELHSIFGSGKAVQASNAEQRFKECGGAECDILNCKAYIEQGCKIHDINITSMRSELNIINNELSLINDFCTLGIYLTYNIKFGTDKVSTIGLVTKQAIGVEAVERILNKGRRLCRELIDDLGRGKPTGEAEWDEKRSIVTYNREVGHN